jgi:hypothetical protein
LRIDPAQPGRKAQLFSTDMIIAIMLFILIFISIVWAGDFINTKIQSRENGRVMAIMADYAISSLVETQGEPAGWQNLADAAFNETNVKSLGLSLSSTEPWVLDLTKIDRLAQLDSVKYETIKRILGLRGANFEFLLRLEQKDRPSGIRIGIEPLQDSQNIILLSRQALINSSYSNLTLIIWERCRVMCG